MIAPLVAKRLQALPGSAVGAAQRAQRLRHVYLEVARAQA